MRQCLLIALHNFTFGIILYIFVLLAYWYFTIFYWQPVQYVVDVSFSTDTHWRWIWTVAETCRRAVYLLKLAQFVGDELVFQWINLLFLLNNRSHDHIAVCSDVYTGQVVILGITIVILINLAPGFDVWPSYRSPRYTSDGSHVTCIREEKDGNSVLSLRVDQQQEGTRD